jgi:hypothetical protein
MILTVAFLAVTAVLCAAAVLLILGVAHVYLSGSAAFEHDGLARGRLAPRWSLPDASGALHTSPPAGPLQLVVFADHSLKSFPSVVDGLRELIARDPDLETVVLLRQRSDFVGPVLEMIGLGGVPVLTATPALYADYNVRVGPFAIFVDAAGQVRASSLVNHDWQVAKLRQLAELEISADEQAAAARRPGQLGSLGPLGRLEQARLRRRRPRRGLARIGT